MIIVILWQLLRLLLLWLLLLLRLLLPLLLTGLLILPDYVLLLNIPPEGLAVIKLGLLRVDGRDNMQGPVAIGGATTTVRMRILTRPGRSVQMRARRRVGLGRRLCLP